MAELREQTQVEGRVGVSGYVMQATAVAGVSV